VGLVGCEVGGGGKGGRGGDVRGCRKILVAIEVDSIEEKAEYGRFVVQLGIFLLQRPA
jgi:hypothetical protein